VLKCGKNVGNLCWEPKKAQKASQLRSGPHLSMLFCVCGAQKAALLRSGRHLSTLFCVCGACVCVGRVCVCVCGAVVCVCVWEMRDRGC